MREAVARRQVEQSPRPETATGVTEHFATRNGRRNGTVQMIAAICHAFWCGDINISTSFS
jgi:hypothetical protein